MHILHVVRDMHPREGGPPRVVAGAAAALARLGHEVTVATTVGPGDDAEVYAAWPNLSASGVELQLFPKSAPQALGGSRALDSALRADIDKYDVCHMHGVWDQCLITTARGARSVGLPYIISPHGMLDRWSISRSHWKKQAVLRLGGGRRFFDDAAAMIFGTADEGSEAAFLRPSCRKIVVPNGIDPSLLGLHDETARERLYAAVPQIAGWSRIILFYSRFHPKKGLDMLIRAFATVANDYPNVGLLAAGIPEDADYTDASRTLATTMGMENRIVVTTHFSGPSSRFLLDAADIFVLPSHQEGFSIAIIEAMGRGLPVLITDRCHLPEVEEQGAGRIVEPNVEGLVQGLRSLLDQDAKTLAAIGQAGAELVAAHYTWPQVAQSLAAVYSDLKPTERDQ